MIEITRDIMINNIKLRLGGQMVDIELDPDHYEFAITRAIQYYRRRSSGALEETYLFLEIDRDTTEYTLPDEVQEVRALYRRNFGNTAVSGISIDPFDLAFTNAYILGALTGGGGGMASYYMVSAFRETMGKLFGSELNFLFESRTKKLKILRRINSTENVAIHVYNEKPESVILNDPYASTWLEDYAHAHCKIMVGEARSKFTTLPGAGGSTAMNGTELKSEGLAELERLEDDIRKLSEGNDPLGFIIG